MLFELLADIREFLHDPDGDRWSDDSILRKINTGQAELVARTHALRKTIRIGLRNDKVVYELPEDLTKLTRVTINGCPLEFITHSALDSLTCGCWEQARGRPTHVVIDKHNRHKLRLYPIPDNTDFVLYEPNSLYGGWTELGSYNYDNLFGIITDVQNKLFEIGGLYGTTTNILLKDMALLVHYDYKPSKLVTMEDELEIEPEYIPALLHYVCGHLLRQDRDTNSRSLGNEEIALFEGAVRFLKKESNTNYNNTNGYSVPYRRV